MVKKYDKKGAYFALGIYIWVPYHQKNNTTPKINISAIA